MQGIEKATADTAAVDAKYSMITTEHIERTDKWHAAAEKRLDSSEVRLLNALFSSCHQHALSEALLICSPQALMHAYFRCA